MSTIDPSLVDPTKPESLPASPSTAVERSQRQVVQDQFTNAKTDIEALESGKEDVGVAASEVATHDASGAAHGGVEAAFGAHEGAGGIARHPNATGALSGFMSVLDKQKLDGIGDGAQKGTVEIIQQNGAQVTQGDTTLDFRATGDATVTVTSQAGNVTRVSIDATAGGGGGGIGKGAPFVVGDLMAAESSAGDGAANTIGVSASALSSHLGDGTIHFTEASITHNNVGGRTTAGAHPTSAITGLDAALAAKLENVVEDTTPVLGGDLETKGNLHRFTRSDDTLWGVAGAGVSFDGAAIAYSRDGTYDLTNGAVAAQAGLIGLFGTSVSVDTLKHAATTEQQVMVSSEGILYRKDIPPVGWTAQDTSTTTASMGTGTGTGSWVDTDLTVVMPQDVEAGQRLDISVNCWIENRTDDKAGVISFGFGFNGASPTAPSVSVSLAEYFDGWVAVAFSTLADQAYPSGNTVDVFVRRESSDDSNFNPWIAYEGTTPHEGLLSTPGSSSGGGTGDVSQGTGGATGEVAVWQDFAGKLVHATGIPAADIVTGPVSAANNNLAVFDGTTGKLLADSGINSAAPVLRNATAEIDTGIGYTSDAPRQLAGGTSETVNPALGNYVEITGSSGTTTLTAGANVGTVVYYVPVGVSIGLTGFTVGSGSKADPGSAEARLCICTQGPINRASFD